MPQDYPAYQALANPVIEPEVGTLPDWQPNWTEVRFDYAAAEALAAAAQSGAVWLDLLADRRHDTIRWALADSAGPWAHRLHELFGRQGSQAREGAERLRRFAGRVRNAAEAAHAEQTQREHARDAWMIERAALEDIARLRRELRESEQSIIGGPAS